VDSQPERGSWIMKPYVVGFIFARGGSRAIPRKNIRHLAGKPLIAYAIETSLKSRHIDRVIVSTDDQEIARVSRKYGAEVPFLRPRELAMDDSPEWMAWQHAVCKVKELDPKRDMDVFVSVPATSPLRSVEDVDNCIDIFLNSDADIIITIRNAHRHPAFNMVVVDTENNTRLVMPPNKPIYNRQNAPIVYDVTMVAFVTSPLYIMSANSLHEGKVKSVLIPEERALDIDTDLEFELAEYLLTKKGGKRD